jgi:hypothetical protein
MHSAIAPASVATCIPRARHQTNNVLSLCAITFSIVSSLLLQSQIEALLYNTYIFLIIIPILLDQPL